MQLAAKPTDPQPSQAPRLSAASILRGRIVKPPRILLYGPEGVGKTTFAADAPNPIFGASEDGTNEFDVPRIPLGNWEQALEMVDMLENDAHDYQTFAIDTADWLDWLCERFICRTSKPARQNLQDFGYGKGYDAQCDEWKRFLVRLDNLRDRRGLTVVLLAHSQVKTFDNPEGDDYGRYQLKLQKKLSEATKEWADCVLFANFDTVVFKEDEKARRGKGLKGRARFIHTERTAAFDAKNRYGLPAKLPLSWLDFDIARGARQPDEPEKIRARIAAVLPDLDEKTRKDTESSLERCGDDSIKLCKLESWIQGKIEIKKENE